MNKFWESEVGSYVRRFRQCRVHIYGPRPCLRVNNLAKIISETTFVPIINSISMNFCDEHEEDHCESQSSQSNAIGELTEKLPLKYLEIYGCGGRDRNVGPVQCPAVQFVIKLFREKLTDVIELSFAEFPGLYETFFEQDWTPALPKLKVLHLGTYDFEFKDYKKMKNFMSKILREAPNLQKLKADTDTYRFLQILPKEKYPLLDSFSLYAHSDEQKKYCWDLAEAEPKLASLCVQVPPSSERRHLESCLGIVEELMTSSSETLKELLLFVVGFSTRFLYCPPMVHLKELKIFGRNGLPVFQFLAMLRCINYPKMLPSLSQVYVNVRLNDEDVQNPWGNDNAVANVMYSATTVQELTVAGADFNELRFQDLSTIFPEVSILWATAPWGTQRPIPYDDLFASWPRLEVLHVTEGTEALRMNLDSQFLGIDPEEVEILREMDDNSLEKVHIVPTRPCLLTMQRKLLRIKLLLTQNSMLYSSIGLEKLSFSIFPGFAVAEELPPDQSFLSKLTGILALRKMIRKGVEIRFSGTEGSKYIMMIITVPLGFSGSSCVKYLFASFSILGLNHLRPFASEDRDSGGTLFFYEMY